MIQTFQKKEIKLHSPFCAVISGQSGSGKTSFIIKLLQHKNEVFNENFKNILYCYGQYTKLIPNLQKLDVKINQGFPSNELLHSIQKPLLLILDDLMLVSKREVLAELFTKKSHHSNISIVYVTQNLFEKPMKIVRDNSQYIILLNSPSSALQIRTLGSQLFPSNLKYFLSAYKAAVSDKKYGYLLIDLHPVSSEELRLRTNIFKEDDFQIIFIPS